MRRVVVIGGGIAGLAAAHALRNRDDLEVLVLEGARRIGGKLLTSEVGGIAVDAGAEAMLVRAPEGAALAREVGLGEQLVHPGTARASLVIDGSLHPVPGGTVMGVPGEPEAVRGVLSEDGLARLRAEPAGDPVHEDVAVGQIVAERLGPEVVARLVDPLLGGVYAGSAAHLSLQATVPALARQLERTGSMLDAVRAVQQQAPRAGGPVFATLRDGLGTLPAAVAAASGARIECGTTVREIQRTAGGFRVVAGPVPAPVVFAADAVIVAAPAAKAAGMLRGVAPQAAADLAAIEYASTALVTFVYGDVPLPAGSGVLVPATEGRVVKALTFSSQKWPHLSGTVVRASVGRFGDEKVLHRDDDDLAEVVAQDVAAIAGPLPRPIARRVTRWGGALPQYTVGHLDRVRRIRAAVAEVPGLDVCGAAYDGVGVPACIRTGQDAAARVLAGFEREGESVHG